MREGLGVVGLHSGVLKSGVSARKAKACPMRTPCCARVVRLGPIKTRSVSRHLLCLCHHTIMNVLAQPTGFGSSPSAYFFNGAQGQGSSSNNYAAALQQQQQQQQLSQRQQQQATGQAYHGGASPAVLQHQQGQSTPHPLI